MSDEPDGDVINHSYSTNAPHVRASILRILAHDADLRAMLRTGLILVAIELLLLGGAVALFATGHWILGTLGALLALPLLGTALRFLYYLPRALLMVRTMFFHALLTPAVVVRAEPVRLVCLAAMGNGMDKDYWGLKVLDGVSLPGHQGRVGEIIPCVSVFDAGEELDRWEDFTPRPIGWGTGDPDEIRRCLGKLDAPEVAKLRELVAAKRFPGEPGKVQILDA